MLRKFVLLLSERANFMMTLSGFIEWVESFAIFEHVRSQRNHILFFLKKYKQGVDFLAIKLVRIGSRGPKRKEYVLSNDLIKAFALADAWACGGDGKIILH